MESKPTLLDETRELLINRPASLKVSTIAKAVEKSGAWVNMIANGTIVNPGFQTLLKLNEFLKSYNNASKSER